VALVFTEWLNANENRKYPLHDEAGAVGLPNDILADANIWIPRSAGACVFLSSVSITNSLITMTFAAASENPICGSPSPSFVPVAVLNVKKPAVRFKNYALVPYIDGAGGWVALGKGATEADGPLFLSFPNPKDGLLADRAVRAYPSIPVRTLGKEGITPPLQGLIRLAGVDGSTFTKGAVLDIGGKKQLVGLIGLDTTENGVAKLQEFAGPCGHRPQSQTCNKTPIVSINGVTPDCEGNIDIAFTGLPVIGDTGDGLLFDSPLGLNEACPGSPFAKFVEETGDDCFISITEQPKEDRKSVV